MKAQARMLNMRTVISQDEDGMFVADCPAIPGCHSQGKTYEEALQSIQEAINLCLLVAKKDKEYRKSIDFGHEKRPRFIGIQEIPVLQPSYV